MKNYSDLPSGEKQTSDGEKMNDLISRKAVLETLRNYFASMIDKRKYNIDTVDCNADLQKIVTNIDTAYDMDKVVERLELENKRLKTLKNNCIALGDHEVIGIESRAYRFAIDIVRGGKDGNV